MLPLGSQERTSVICLVISQRHKSKGLIPPDAFSGALTKARKASLQSRAPGSGPAHLQLSGSRPPAAGEIKARAQRRNYIGPDG